MVTCNFCQHSNPDNVMFCTKCGSTLTKVKSTASSSYSSSYTDFNDYSYTPKKNHTKLFVGLGAGLGAVVLAVVLLFAFVFNGDDDTYTKSSKKTKTYH